MLATCADGLPALLERDTVDIILLDVMMPKVDGFTLLGRLRQMSDAPIVMVTALGDDQTIQRGFALGADDYLVKPFSDQQLGSRLGHLAAQMPGIESEPNIAVGRFDLNPTAHLLLVDGEPIGLAPTETAVLLRLMARPGQPASAPDLYRAGWGREPESAEQGHTLVNVVVTRLRQKIETHPGRPQHLITVAGTGYQLNPDRPAR
jgi:DNA-binding response OmpR family regulator